jgi:GH25 family lysozyme M1 (1,4-beta-N-acetylmuramidase)
VTNELGVGGCSARDHKPVWNIHRLINHLFAPGELAFPNLLALIVQQKKYPDVSFYQGEINWDTMREKTDAVVIRAGQNLWVDSQFHWNYQQAKRRGMLRGVYYFYDDRVSPGAQAAKIAELIATDLPEMEVWIDWERSYGGGFQGLRNVVACMQDVERRLPSVRVGLYTGYYWFIENSNALLNASQYDYLKNKPLWLAWYAAASLVKVPAPWTRLDLWQYGTPTEDYGQVSQEIDMNFHNGTTAEFYERYQAEPPVIGEPMAKNKVTILYPDGARERQDPHAAGTLRNLLAVNTVHYSDFDEVPDMDDPTNTGKRWIKLQSGWYIATRYPASNGITQRARVEPVVTEPAAEYVVDCDVTLTAPDGKRYEGTLAGLRLRAVE